MKPSLRLIGGAAALLIVSTAATACNASPFAATVNSQVIKQTALYSELRAWSGNSAYVAAFDSANVSSNSASGSTVSVTVAGDGPGTFSTTWVANILDGMITAAIVHQAVVATGPVPSPGMEAASRAVNEIAEPGWEQFSPAFRQTLASRFADIATITPPSAPVATLRSAYDHYLSYFFTRVCVIQAAAFTLTQAQSTVAGGVSNGAPTCYDQAQFEQQASGFQTAVRGRAVGTVAPPVKTSYGYQVIKVVSRDVLGFTADTQRVLSAAIGQSSPVLTGLVAKARVQVNPAFGTWKTSTVVPPVQPSPTA